MKGAPSPCQTLPPSPQPKMRGKIKNPPTPPPRAGKAPNDQYIPSPSPIHPIPQGEGYGGGVPRPATPNPRQGRVSQPCAPNPQPNDTAPLPTPTPTTWPAPYRPPTHKSGLLSPGMNLYIPARQPASPPNPKSAVIQEPPRKGYCNICWVVQPYERRQIRLRNPADMAH